MEGGWPERRAENCDGTGARSSTGTGERSSEGNGERRRWSERGREHELCEERSLNVERTSDEDERSRTRRAATAASGCRENMEASGDTGRDGGRGGGGRDSVEQHATEHRQSEDGQQEEGERRGRDYADRGGGRGDEGAPCEALVILYCNAQSVAGKINELNAVAADQEPDLILITESWCNKNVNNAFLTLQGYELQQDLRLDREDTADGRGGGLLVYAKQGLKILAIDSGVDFVQHRKFLVRDITCYLVYRPPNGSVVNMTKLADLIRAADKNSVMIGDFNLPGVDWTTGHCRANEKQVVETIEEKLMVQVVDFPTHIKGNILDLVITNVPERVLEVREEGRLGKSDHSILVVEMSVGKGGVKKDESRQDLEQGRLAQDGGDAERERMETGNQSC
jgi:hypothetical protein